MLEWQCPSHPVPIPFPLASGGGPREPTCMGDKSLSLEGVRHSPPRPLPPALKASHTQVVKLPL